MEAQESNTAASSVCIIPARAGSKRILGKNIKLFADKPLLGWTIEAAVASKLFSKVIVSTDSPAIAAIARSFGAQVPFLRPAELADDHATIDQVIFHALDWLRAKGEEPSYVMRIAVRFALPSC